MIDFVEHVQARAIFHSEVGENLYNLHILLGVMRVGNVGDVEDERSLLHFLESGAEGGDQIRREIAEKSDRVRNQDAATGRQTNRADCRIERGEHFRRREHFSVRERVEESGFSGVRVADESNHAERHSLAGAAARGSLAANRFDGFFNFTDAVANPAAIGFEFLFAGAARADAAAEARELFAASREAREKIIQLRELHLELAFARARVRGENIEDELRAVDHAAANSLLHVAKLNGREIVVDNHERNTVEFRFHADFVDFAAAYERGGIERFANLQQRAGNVCAGADC